MKSEWCKKQYNHPVCIMDGEPQIPLSHTQRLSHTQFGNCKYIVFDYNKYSSYVLNGLF